MEVFLSVKRIFTGNNNRTTHQYGEVMKILRNFDRWYIGVVWIDVLHIQTISNISNRVHIYEGCNILDHHSWTKAYEKLVMKYILVKAAIDPNDWNSNRAKADLQKCIKKVLNKHSWLKVKV